VQQPLEIWHVEFKYASVCLGHQSSKTFNAVVTPTTPLAPMSSREYFTVHYAEKKIFTSMLPLFVTFNLLNPLKCSNPTVIQALMNNESLMLQHPDFITDRANLT